LGDKYDEWNETKKKFALTIQSMTNINMHLLGIGTPVRTPGYILGRQTKFIAPKTGN